MAFRLTTFADIRAGRPAPVENVSLVLEYLLDQEFSYQRERVGTSDADRFAKYLHDMKIAEEHRTSAALLPLVTEPSLADNPFAAGLAGIAGFSALCGDPLRAVRPCRSDEIEVAAYWLYIDAGRRLEGKVTPEARAVDRCSEFLCLPIDEYIARLRAWSIAVPWSTVVAGDDDNHPRVMTINLPLSESRYRQLRAGEVYFLDLLPEPGITVSKMLFAEALGRRPDKPRTRRAAAPILMHLFRAVVCQQAVLSDLPDMGRRESLHVLAPRCFAEIEQWMRMLGYRPVGSLSPRAGFPIWERVAWGKDSGLSERPSMGVWHAIQDELRGRHESIGTRSSKR